MFVKLVKIWESEAFAGFEFNYTKATRKLRDKKKHYHAEYDPEWSAWAVFEVVLATS